MDDNTTTALVQYSCLDTNLSISMVTTSYWRVNSSLTAQGIVTGSVMLIFFLVGLPCNVLIVLTILLQKLYREPTHLLLLSLAVGDILMCLLVMPVIIISGFAGEFVLGESDYTRCKVCQLGVALVTLGDFSLHILALISLDRFLFIKYPLRYERLVTKSKAMVLIVAAGMLSILLGIPPLFGFGDIYFDHTTFSCSARFDSMTDITKNVYYMVLVGAEGVLPLSVLIATNIGIVWIAHKHIKQIYSARKTFGTTNQLALYHQKLMTKLRQEKYTKQLQLVRTFGVIFVAHLITWIPLIIRIFESLILDSDDFPPWSDFIIIVSITLFPVLHPIVEACVLQEIRQYLFVICSCKKADTDKIKNNNLCCWKHCSNNCADLLGVTVILPQTELEQIQNDVHTHNRD